MGYDDFGCGGNGSGYWDGKNGGCGNFGWKMECRVSGWRNVLVTNIVILTAIKL